MQKGWLPFPAHVLFVSYQFRSFVCKIFGFFGNFLSFVNIVLNIAVSFEGCSGIEGDVFSLIKDSGGMIQKKRMSGHSMVLKWRTSQLLRNLASKWSWPIYLGQFQITVKYLLIILSCSFLQPKLIFLSNSAMKHYQHILNTHCILQKSLQPCTLAGVWYETVLC